MNKKNVLIVIGILFFLAITIFALCFPKFLKEYELKANEVVQNNCKIYTKEILNTTDINKLEEASIYLLQKLNENYKNPLAIGEKAFSLNTKCKGCVNIEYDGTTQSVSVTGYDKNLKILCRTIVKPPSYVTYEREK